MRFRLKKITLTMSGFVVSLLISTSVHAAVANGLIAYPCRTEGGFQNICLVTPEGTGNVQITSGGHNALPSWSPDGRMLAYTHYDKDPNTGMEFLAIAVLDIDDLSTQFISPGFAPAWSPDGSKIAFTRPSLTSPTPEIFTMDPHGADQQQVTDVPGVPKLGATWSPDSQSIAYAQPDPGNPGHNIISVTRLADKNTYVLTDNFICPGTPPAPCFHNLDADGDIIASQPVL